MAAAQPRRSSRDKLAEAQGQARAINDSWEDAAGTVAPDPGKASGADFENILPVGYDPEANAGAVVVAGSPTSPASPDDQVAVPMEGTVKGRQVEYYSSEQAMHNLMLKAAVAENEELLTTLHELQGEQVSNARALLATRNHNRAERLRDFDEGYRWPDPSGFSGSSLVDRFELTLSMEALAELGELRHPQLVPLFAILEELLTKRAPPARRQAIDQEAIPIVRAYLQKASHPDMHAHCMRMHEFVHTDVFQYIKGELARSGERMKVLLAELEQVELQRESALKADDIVTADDCHRRSVALLEKLIAAVRERLNQISMSSEDSGNFRGRFGQFRDNLNRDLDATRGDKEQLKKDILADLATLAARGEQAAQENEDALAKYASYQQGSNQMLNDNAKRQDQLWEQIQDMVHEMKCLGDKRFAEVNMHLKATEDEERRKREYAEFSEVYAEHCRRMEELLRNTDNALRMLDAYTEYFNQGCDQVDRKGCDEELRDIRLTEMKRYLEFYRKYALIAGDLIIRRKARLQGLDRLVRTTGAQLQMCIDALDPHRSMYKEELKKLTIQRDEVRNNLEELEEKFRDQRQDFQPTEDLLEEMDVDFLPPRIEHDEMETVRRNQHLSLAKELVQAEQDEVDVETTNIRKLTTETKMTKETVGKKREQRKKQATPQKGSGPAV
eukprot:TRINITY_DN321_c0_g2_i1.p1 TRINITY_DN321_c0_g2~~TRINITY_DN321_c0_g2_i1.p1  ORF type:complete len:673 (+),score=281.88 TRINITY_DN321_c0_g2_i1:82-2100(+)